MHQQQNDDHEDDGGQRGAFQAVGAGGDKVAANAGRTRDVHGWGARPGLGDAAANALLGRVRRGPRLNRQVRRTQRYLDQRAVTIGAEQTFPDQGIAVRADAHDLQTGVALPQLVEIGDHALDESEVGRRQRRVGPLDGDDEAAGEHVLREGLFEQAMAANTVAAGRQEADVVVDGPVVPARRHHADGAGDDQPGQADEPGMRRREAPEILEHGPCLPW